MNSHSAIEVHTLLENIAKSPISTATFPTHLRVLLRLKSVLNDPDISFKKAGEIINGEPLIALRIISAANAAIFFGRPEILEMEQAIFRLGLGATKRVALSVAMSQLGKSKDLLIFANTARVVWLHSLYTAAAAFVVASELTTVHPEEAQTIALLANIGAFYLLYRYSEKPLLRDASGAVNEAVGTHYLHLTREVVKYVGLPDVMQEALQIEMSENIVIKVPPKNMLEVVRVANVLASEEIHWDEGIGHTADLSNIYLDLKDRIRERYAYLQKEYI